MDKQVGKGVSGGRRDLLVVINGDRAEESFKQISANYKLQQVASSRVFVVECDQSELTELTAISGVTVVTSSVRAAAATACELTPIGRVS